MFYQHRKSFIFLLGVALSVLPAAQAVTVESTEALLPLQEQLAQAREKIGWIELEYLKIFALINELQIGLSAARREISNFEQRQQQVATNQIVGMRAANGHGR